MDDFETRLLDLIAEESGLDPQTLKASPGLMSTGLLDSFALVTVISLVETHLGDEVPPADLTFDNFDTIASICAYVERALVT
jgi:acyl carrier protein